MNKKFVYVATLLFLGLFLIPMIISACASDADVASTNISQDADNFKITRRIVFYNGITDSYILVVEGKCSLGNSDPNGQLSVTCKVGDGQYKKHFLGLSDNVTYFAEQIESSTVNPYQYKVTFKPESVIPDLNLNTSNGK